MNSPLSRSILVVERNDRNLVLMTDLLRQHGYDSLSASDFDAVEQVLCQAREVSLALVDLSGFDQRIWHYCELIQARGVPLLLIAPPTGAELQRQGLAHGARGVLVKPVPSHQLLELVARLLDA